MKFTYLSENDMGFFEANKLHPVESLYLNKHRQSLIDIERRKEWKQNTDLKLMGGLGPMLGQKAERDVNYEITGACFCKDEIIYSIKIDGLGGLFKADPSNQSKFEGHLAHDNNVRFGSVQYKAESNKLLYSFGESFTDENIFIRDLTTDDIDQITEGESIDRYPSWDLSDSPIINYQSAGVGRDHYGNYWGTSPSSIYQLNTENNELNEIASDPDLDFLLPKSLNGEVYYIQKPHIIKETNYLGFLEIFTIPFKLVKLVYQMINFKNMQYTGKPLMGQDQMAKSDLTQQRLSIHGNLVNAQKELRKKHNKKLAYPSIVPNDWKLIRQNKEGEKEVIAEGVIAYDIDKSGNIIYSNGSSVSLLDTEKNHSVLIKNRFIKMLSF